MTHEVNETIPAPLSLNSKKTTAAKPPQKRKKQRTFDWMSDHGLPVRGETALWVAVITQAMMDALSKASNSEARYHKYEAINWLTGNSKNFATVCFYAGLDPDYVRKKAKRALASPSLWRAEPGKGSRYHERKAYRKRVKTTPKETPEHVTGDNVIPGPWRAINS